MSASIAWTYLLAAGLLDVLWAGSVKLSAGFVRPVWTTVSIGLVLVLVYLLGRATTVVPIGTAYVVWTGIGASGTVLLGWAAFGEPLGAVRLSLVALIMAAVAALRWLGE